MKQAKESARAASWLVDSPFTSGAYSMRSILSSRAQHLLGTLICLLALPLSFAAAADLKPAPLRSNVALEPGKPSGVAPAKADFRSYLEAARAAQAAKAAYAAETGSLDSLLMTQQQSIDAEIAYARATAFSRGDPATQQYTALRREVSTLERSVAEMKKLARAVPSRDKETVRAEVDRYEVALKQAKEEFGKASTAWRTSQRSQQFQYLKRP
jgi:hypothetical protein